MKLSLEFNVFVVYKIILKKPKIKKKTNKVNRVEKMA